MANEAQIKLSRGAVIGGITIGGVEEVVLADVEQVFKETIPTTYSDHVINVGVTVDNIRVSALQASQDLTVKTYDGVTLKQTLAVKKNIPLLWSINHPDGLAVFTDDFDSIKVTNASGTAALLMIGFGLQQDPGGSA